MLIKIISGNDVLHSLTFKRKHELKVDLEMFSGVKGYAKYSTFSVGSESEKYKLTVTGYTGNAGMCREFRWLSICIAPLFCFQFSCPFLCLFVCLEFFVPLENFSLIWRRHLCLWRAANCDLCSALMVIQQCGFFSVSHLLRHGASVYNGNLWGPLTLTPNAERLAVELSLRVFTT